MNCIYCTYCCEGNTGDLWRVWRSADRRLLQDGREKCLWKGLQGMTGWFENLIIYPGVDLLSVTTVHYIVISWLYCELYEYGNQENKN